MININGKKKRIGKILFMTFLITDLLYIETIISNNTNGHSEQIDEEKTSSIDIEKQK